MKKVIALIAVAFVAVTLNIGCDKGGSSTTAKTSGSTVKTTEGTQMKGETKAEK